MNNFFPGVFMGAGVACMIWGMIFFISQENNYPREMCTVNVDRAGSPTQVTQITCTPIYYDDTYFTYGEKRYLSKP
jgi:hypothetical protein